MIDGAELCWDGLTGDNHKKIMENIQAYTAGDGTAEPEEEPEVEEPVEGEPAPAKKVVIKLFKMTNTKVRIFTLPIPNVLKSSQPIQIGKLVTFQRRLEEFGKKNCQIKKKNLLSN